MTQTSNAAICDENCFECQYADCIREDLSEEDIMQSEILDLVALEERLTIEEKRKNRKRELTKLWKAKNRESYAAKRRAYNLAHKAEQNAYSRRYYEKHREKELARNKKYWDENKAAINARRRAQRAETKEKKSIAQKKPTP